MQDEAMLSTQNPKSLVKKKLGESFELSPLGLAIVGTPSLDEWLEVGKLLSRATGATSWWRGDWIIYGEKTYNKYKEAMETTGLKYGTLANDKYVAKRVKVSYRYETLTWHHHAAVARLEPEQQLYWLNYAQEKNLKPEELRIAIKGAKEYPWLRYTDVWNFSGCDDRFGIEYSGRIPGQIIQNLLYYYTNEGDFIIDPMAGGGTTLDVCTKCDAVKRECLAFDIKSIRSDIVQADATEPWPTDKKADLVFIDPPYWSQQEDAYQGMAIKSYTEFLDLMERIFMQVATNLKPHGILSILIAPMAIKVEYTDIPFDFVQLCSKNYKLIRRISVPVGSQQVGPYVQKSCKDKRIMLALIRDLLIFKPR